MIVTRRHDRFTNLFLPGFWPHALLYLGSRSPDRSRDVLEARKDGVRLRTLADALDVDAAAVVRPRLGGEAIEAALQRALQHEGKLYDFDFDFFTSDRLVCTELVYRTYDGAGEVNFELTERAGKPTLSAEDILATALRGEGFDVHAVLGVRGARGLVLEEGPAREALARSLES